MKAYRFKEPNFRFHRGTYSICWWGIEKDKPYDYNTRKLTTHTPFIVYIPPYEVGHNSFTKKEAQIALSNLFFGLQETFTGFEEAFDIKVPPLDEVDSETIAYNDRWKLKELADKISNKANIAILLTKYESHLKRDSAHNYAKIYFTRKGLPSQVITAKIMKERLKKNGQYSAMLRNISVCMYKKIGGIPWVLSRSLGAENAYIGFRYLYAHGYVFITVQLFDHQGAYVTGTLHRYPRENKLFGIKLVLKEVLNYLLERKKTKRVIMHQIGEIFQEDLEQLKETFNEYPFEFAIVSIKIPTNPAWRIYKMTSMDNMVERGLCVPLDPNKAVLTLTGSPFKVPEGTPQGRIIELKYPQAKHENALLKICQEIFNLSDVNFSYALAYKGVPMTADFATRIVERCVLGGYPEEIHKIEDLEAKSRFFNAYW